MDPTNSKPTLHPAAPAKRVSTDRWRGKTTTARRRPAPPPVPTRAQAISPVFGKTFLVPAPVTTLLTNLHRNHRALMETLALELHLQVEYREDAKFQNGKLNPDAYAVHVLTPGYDRDQVLQELHARIIIAWAEAQSTKERAQ